MPLHPVPRDRGELAGLQAETPVVPRRHAHRVFIEPDLRLSLARIEAVIDPRFHKHIDVGTGLRVEEKGEPRVRKIVAVGIEKSGGRLLDLIVFEVGEAAELHPERAVECAGSEIVVHASHEILLRGRDGPPGEQEQRAEEGRSISHGLRVAVAMASRKAGMRTGLLARTSMSGKSFLS